MTNEKNIPNDSSGVQQIKKRLRECISFNGILTRLHFWECMIIGYVFYSFFLLLKFLILISLVGFAIFISP